MESRKYFRFPCQFFGEVRMGSKDIEKVLIQDISCGGIRMLVQKVDPLLNPNIEVRLDFPRKPAPLLLSGEIIWSNRVEHSLEIGIKFENVDDDIRKELQDYGFSVWRSEEKLAQLRKTFH